MLKRVQTHIDEVFAEALLEVAKEGHLCGVIQKDEILDTDPVPGSQGTLHVQLTLHDKFNWSFKSAGLIAKYLLHLDTDDIISKV